MATILAKGGAPISRGARIGGQVGTAFGQALAQGATDRFKEIQQARIFDPVREALQSALATSPAPNPISQVLQSVTADPQAFAQMMQNPQQLQAISGMGELAAGTQAKDPFPELSEITATLQQAQAYAAAGDTRTADLLNSRAASLAGLDPNKPGAFETLQEIAMATQLATEAEAAGNQQLAQLYRGRAATLSGGSPAAFDELDQVNEALDRANAYEAQGDTTRAQYFRSLAQQTAGIEPAAMTELEKNIRAAGYDPAVGEGRQLMLEGIRGRQNVDQRTQRIDNLVAQGAPRELAANFVDGFAEKQTNPTTGAVELVDAISGTRWSVPPAAAATVQADAAMGAPAPTAPVTGEQGDTLWDLAEAATGLGSGVKLAVSRTADLLGWGVTAPNAEYARAVFNSEIRNLIRALALNDRFPVAEQERIINELNIEPSAFTGAGTMRARMTGMRTTLERDAANYWALANRPGLDPSTRESYANASLSIQDFLKVMGVPNQQTAPETPATLPAGIPAGSKAIGVDDKGRTIYEAPNGEYWTE